MDNISSGYLKKIIKIIIDIKKLIIPPNLFAVARKIE